MGRDPYLEVRLQQWEIKAALGKLRESAEEDWIEAAEIASAFLERYRLARKRGRQTDLAIAQEIASWGFERTSGALREHFATLLAGARAAGR
jgi:hypothetical protein